jgi:RHS repeat-associated protein
MLPYSRIATRRHGGWLATALLVASITVTTRAQSVEGLVPDSTELRVLRQFYHHTGGSGWASHGSDHWLEPATRVSDLASWRGVLIDNGDIIRLSLANNGLQGDLPACLSELRRLQLLDVSGNQLGHALPGSLGTLPDLAVLQLFNNQFTGPLPAAWGQSGSLQYLMLYHNPIADSIPAAWGGMRELRALWLGGCRLRGDLPARLSRLRQLDYLDLNDNQLTGAIPAEWGRMARLSQLLLHQNALGGALPDSLANLTQLQYLSLYRNRIAGSLPAAWNRLAHLRTLMLGQNRLTGNLPAGWSVLSSLELLELSSNQLSGTIPGSWSNLQFTTGLSLANNRLSGPIPDGLRGRVLLLNNNRFSGRLPDSYAQARTQQGIRQLMLEGNDLIGIPGFSGGLGTPNIEVGLTGNLLQYDSYEANLAVPGQYQFFDNGQRTPTRADTQQVVTGTQPWLRRPFGGQHNHYQWQRKLGQLWVNITPAPDADALQLPAATEAMEGEYRVEVTNNWLPWMKLYSRSLYVSLLPYDVPARNEPLDAGCSAPLNAFMPPDRAGASDSVNYLRTFVPRTAYTSAARMRQAVVDSVQIKTDYLDGLGRPVQTVMRQESPGRRDMVQPMAYDALNRQTRQYLPFTADNAQQGAYRPNALREQYDFYRTPTLPGIPVTGVPFAESGFEASPLNRVLAQASAGETWRMGALANHVARFAERTNRLAEDTVQQWKPGYSTEREDLIRASGPYPDGSLWVKQATDEQGQMSREYTDLEGRIVLKQVALSKTGSQVSWLSTYYIYDDFGRLRAVLPPRAVQLIRRHQWQVDGAGVERLLFRYHYDAQGRLIEKLVPDTDGYQYTVYNELDQPVLSQDAAQRARDEWMATKYDVYGRVVLTALVRRPGQNRTQLAEEAAFPSRYRWEEYSNSVPTHAVLGAYSDQSYPFLTANGQLEATATLLSIAHYDSYDFNHDGGADAHYDTLFDGQLGGSPPVADTRVVGMLTRSQVRVLGVADTAPGAWLITRTFYDEKARPVQVQSTNARGAEDIVTTRYDWAGKPLVSYTVHQGPNHRAIPVRDVFAYDHTGRLLETRQELDGGPAIIVAANSYNELGQLLQKRLGSTTTEPALQTVDYRYNIRGWLTHVNDAQLTRQAGQRPDLFGLELSYDCGFRQNQFNGNIAGQKWRTASDNVERAYGYRYDLLSRILQGDFVARAVDGSWNAERDNYRFWAASYDANGNLLTMRRRGLVQEATRTTPRQYGALDDLRYRYQPAPGVANSASNRLLRVDDLAPVSTTFSTAQPARPDFQDGATTGRTQPDYTYDAAGSLTSDQNKGIDSIRYNHLHLPERIVWHNGNRLEFRYTAAGQKVAKLATATGKPTVRTDYLGAWQYEGDSLRWLTTSEGRALRFVQRNSANQAITRYSYEYTIKDHLGNLRVAFRPGDRATYRALMEPVDSAREEAQFDYVRETRFQTNNAASGQHVARLNAATGKPIGPLKMLPVRKGDSLDIEAFGRYLQPSHNPSFGFSTLGFVLSLLQQPPVVAPNDGRTPRVRPLPFLGVGLAMVPQLVQRGSGVPKGYLRVLVFDKDSTFLTSYTEQLTNRAATEYQRLNITLTAPKDGYVQAYVGNESDTDVYFDDLSIQYLPTLVVQENQYDPFGLDLVGISRYGHTENRFNWNGKEQEAEFGLNWHDHGWRFYSPDLGRWTVSDPDAEEGEQEGWSTYQFGLNNAIRNNDLDGRLFNDYTAKKDGTVEMRPTSDKYDRFFVEGNKAPIAQLDKISYKGGELVHFNVSTEAIVNNATEGRNYIKPELAAQIIGASVEYKKTTGNSMVINQLNDANGGHSGHPPKKGSTGGFFADIRYASKNGTSYDVVWTTYSNFDKKGSQLMVDIFKARSYNNRISILTENSSGDGPALTGTIFPGHGTPKHPFHHKHHMHLQEPSKVKVSLPRPSSPYFMKK